VTIGGWLSVLGAEVRAYRTRCIVLIACTFLVCLGCGIAAQLAGWTRGEVVPYLETAFPEERLVVRAASVDLLFLRMDGERLGPNTARAIETIDGVARVYPQASARFPVAAEIRMVPFDVGFETDIVLHGVDRALVSADLDDASLFRWDHNSGQPVPVLVSAYFLDLYNTGLAESSRMPKLSPAAAIGREFDILLGQSLISFERHPNERSQRARIIGLARDPALMGVIAPREAVERWNAEFADEREPTYSALHVDLVSDRDPDPAVEAIQAKGYRVQRRADQLDALRRIVVAGELVLVGLILLVGGLGIVGVLSTLALSGAERRARWGLMRASGMTPAQLALLIAGELSLLALIGGAMALGALASLIIAGQNWLDQSGLPVAFLPGDPFVLNPWGALVAGGLGFVLLVIPGMLFAIPAMRREPNDLLAQRDL